MLLCNRSLLPSRPEILTFRGHPSLERSFMPRPRPLASTMSRRSDRPEYQVLTPRTPHSRAGRAEEGFTDVELSEELVVDDFQKAKQHQSVPLLVSSRSESFHGVGYRSRGDDFDESKRGGKQGESRLGLFIFCCSHVPLILGSVLAGFLLLLAYVSYHRPEQIKAYLGIDIYQPNTHPAGGAHQKPVSSSHFISYENYTHFPLTSSEYLAECSKLHNGFMSHGKYWEHGAMGTMDVLHQDEQEGYNPRQGDRGICTSTITYMLDGKVGLFADLALLAQAAALAREVATTFDCVSLILTSPFTSGIGLC